MKKLLCAVLGLLLTASGVYSAERSVIRLGMLSKLNATQEAFSEIWRKTYAPPNGDLMIDVQFYDSLTAMLMALNAAQIRQIILPEATANYVLNVNKQGEAALVLPADGMGLAFGFRAEDSQLRDNFNKALDSMREDWTLAAIEGVYTAQPGLSEPEAVKFSMFPGAKTIKAAVTGDLPPIDFIAADGTPVGFNTAVLAEIGRRLQMNIELMEVAAGARTAALTSGRADVVFWYEVNSKSDEQHDIPEGVIISKPYYEWHKFIHIQKAQPRAISRWDIIKGILGLYYTGE